MPDYYEGGAFKREGPEWRQRTQPAATGYEARIDEPVLRLRHRRGASGAAGSDKLRPQRERRQHNSGSAGRLRDQDKLGLKSYKHSSI